MIITNLDIVIKKISSGEIDLDVAAAKATEELKETAIGLIKDEIKGTRPKGQKAEGSSNPPGGPPMNRTGKLRESIKGEMARIGFGSYGAVVGPTAGVYVRAVDVGGKFSPPSWKGTQAEAKGFPYMRPAFIKLEGMVSAILKRHF